MFWSSLEAERDVDFLAVTESNLTSPSYEFPFKTQTEGPPPPPNPPTRQTTYDYDGDGEERHGRIACMPFNRKFDLYDNALAASPRLRLPNGKVSSLMLFLCAVGAITIAIIPSGQLPPLALEPDPILQLWLLGAAFLSGMIAIIAIFTPGVILQEGRNGPNGGDRPSSAQFLTCGYSEELGREGGRRDRFLSW